MTDTLNNVVPLDPPNSVRLTVLRPGIEYMHRSRRAGEAIYATPEIAERLLLSGAVDLAANEAGEE